LDLTFGLQINWSKAILPSSTSSSTFQVADGHVEEGDVFVYLGCMIDSSGGSRGEVLRRIGLARSCMLDRRIWKSSIRLETKLRFYQTYIVPVLVYGARHGPPQSTCAVVLMHLTRGRKQDLEDTVYSPRVKCGSQRNHGLFTVFSPGDI